MFTNRWINRVLLGVACTLFLSPFGLMAQEGTSSSTKSLTMIRPTMTAVLIDSQKLAAKKAAKVQVEVKSFQLVDPASVGEKRAPGQGHLHYRFDQGPIIATTVTQLSFHDVSVGAHKIVVTLVGNDHMPVGPETVLDLQIP